MVVILASACAIDIRLGENRVLPQQSAAQSDPAAESAPPTAPTPGATPSMGPGLRPRGVATDRQLLILDENFHGAALDTEIWNTCHWWDDGGCTIASNDELEWYLPGQVTVGDGMLALTAEQREVVGADGRSFPYVSGMVSTGPPRHDAAPKLAFTFGTVEVRFRAPLGAGLWPAIWMLPASEESKPEIDLFEAVGQHPQQVNMYFHPRRDSGHDVGGTRFDLPADQTLADVHTVRLEWSPGRLDFVFDGRKVWEVTGDQVPDEPMYLVMNLAVGGEYGGPPDPSAFPVAFFIDYARIWSWGAQ